MQTSVFEKRDVTDAASAVEASGVADAVIAPSAAADVTCAARSPHESSAGRSEDVAGPRDAPPSSDSPNQTGSGSGRAGIGNRFTEPKPIEIPPKLYRIGEVIEYSGLSRQTVHNYTTMGLLIEARRTDGGHRLYDESVFARLNGIIALKAQHKSLAHIREYYAKLDAD